MSPPRTPSGKQTTNSHPLLEQFPPATRNSLRQKLNRWFSKHGRSLPWRESQDPYRVWISEIMLQQTTVKAVIPYYERFLARFPSLQSLASASESDVLQHWEGLGYYSRGRNLRLAAQKVVNDFAGVFPRQLDEIQSLPGIGRYTAGAISSFSHDIPAPILEANTLRLYCRLLGFDGDPRSKAGQDLLWKFAEQLQPSDKAGQLNQSLMELGSLVCTPVSPDCEKCPIAQHCTAFSEGRQHEIPAPKQRPQVTATVEATVAIKHNDHFFIRKRTPGERWAGMWDFVRFPIEAIEADEPLKKLISILLLKELSQKSLEQSSVKTGTPVLIKELKHSVTRYRIRLLCFTAETQEPLLPSINLSDIEYKWVTLPELASLPMPVTGRKFSNYLASQS
ncbi:A/G-specific adenine glycosylase [Planctomicrobium sp. SH527]|uniref:A/G-specific adenine glycosylase n=1 Tax=Planctomicrobium sp. SH527 TaxID=3448123 RepID=UPI003F5C59B4